MVVHDTELTRSFEVVGPPALSRSEVARLLATEYGVDDPGLAEQVYDATLGRPALVRLAGAGRPTADPVRQLSQPGTPTASYVDDEILPALTDAARRLLVMIASNELNPVSAGLCEHLGHPDLRPALAELAQLGLLDPPVPGFQRYQPVPVITATIRAKSIVDEQLAVRVAGWYAEHGEYSAAAWSHLRAGAPGEAAAVLVEHGHRVLATDGADAVIGLVGALPAHVVTRPLLLLLAEARALAGDVDEAHAICAPLAGTTALEPDLARLLGQVEYRRGKPLAALEVYQRGRLNGERTAGEARLLGAIAVAHWAAGNPDATKEFAERAHRAAKAANDPHAHATSHTALGFAAEIAGACAAEQRHYQRALAIATAAGDAVEMARAHNNQASRLLGEARFAEALDEAQHAVELAYRTGYRSVLGLALSNAGEGLTRLGRLDEAVDALERAMAVEHRTGSGRLAYPLMYLGDVHRLRGNTSLARAAYEESIRVAGAGDRQGMVPALAGLATVLIGVDPPAAGQFAEQAHQQAAGPAVIAALLARGRVALAGGGAAAATGLAEQAAAQARLHRDRAGLAEALELTAAATGDPGHLAEALAIWRDTGAILDAARVRVMLGGRLGASVAERIDAQAATDQLLAAGVVVPPALTRVEVRTLGRFEVLVDGTPVPPAAWQSRKARDLLRILLARRGRGVSRDELGELLWPADDASRTSHRLSVALSTVRAVLDPGKLLPANHFVLADQDRVALDLSHLPVDVESFFAAAEHGLRLLDRGDDEPAMLALRATERTYTGDFFEDDPYDDWAGAVREEARATYLAVARSLVQLCRRAGDADSAVRYLHRILAKDPYDEQGHRQLITTLRQSGSHGEALRAHQRFTDAMRRIGVATEDQPARRLSGGPR